MRPAPPAAAGVARCTTARKIAGYRLADGKASLARGICSILSRGDRGQRNPRNYSPPPRAASRLNALLVLWLGRRDGRATAQAMTPGERCSRALRTKASQVFPPRR
jgi:hypothetical protein